MVNENNDEKAIDCIKTNFIKAATRLSTVEAEQDFAKQRESSQTSRATNTTGMNNSEAFLWQQMKLAEEAAACSGDGSKNSGKRGSKKAGSKKSRKTHFGSRNARPRPGRDEYDRFRSSSVGKSLSSSTTANLSTGSSSR